MKKIFVFAIVGMWFASALFAQAEKGVIKGRVFNVKNNEPVPFANIVIWGTSIGSISDLDGNFIFTGIKPGFVELRVSAVGFETYISSDVLVTNANPVFIEIPLEESNIAIEEVVVSASPYRKTEESPVSLRRIGIAEIEKNPGGNRDISKVIQSLPGVASTPAFRNDVIVRGGGASENRFYLDGVEIPTINHFATQGASGGPVGIINVDFIREVNFYSSAFPASRGNAMSSVIEFNQIDGNEEKLKFRGTLGASDLALTLDGPLTDNTTYIFSARRSYLQFLFAALELPFLPTYNDFQFKTKTKFNQRSELTFIGLGALDQFELNLDANETPDQRFILKFLPVNEQWNYTFGAVYRRFKDKGSETFVLSRNYLNNTAYKYLDNNEDSLKLFDYISTEAENKFRYERSIRTDNGYKFLFGTGLEYAEYTNRTFQRVFEGNVLQDFDYNASLNMFHYNAFFQGSKKVFNDRLTTSLGARVDGTSYSKEMANPLNHFSPRVSLSYMLSSKSYINFNTGRYFQRPPYTAMGYSENDVLVNKENGLSYITSDHLVAGFEFFPNEQSKLSLEGFYKWYYGYPFSINDSVSISGKSAEFGTFGDEALLSVGEGRAYGFEILARTRNFFDITGLISYTYVWSQFKDVDENLNPINDYIPTAWDNRHLLNITATRSFKGSWDVGFKWRFVGGAPYTPFDLEQSVQRPIYDLQGGPVLDFRRFNELRLGSFHQLDIRVDKGFFFDKWSLLLYLDIQNVYNFKAEEPDRLINEDELGNVLVDDFSLPYTQQRYVLRKIPSDGQGTVLPTIGIIVQL